MPSRRSRADPKTIQALLRSNRQLLVKQGGKVNKSTNTAKRAVLRMEARKTRLFIEELEKRLKKAQADSDFDSEKDDGSQRDPVRFAPELLLN